MAIENVNIQNELVETQTNEIVSHKNQKMLLVNNNNYSLDTTLNNDFKIESAEKTSDERLWQSKLHFSRIKHAFTQSKDRVINQKESIDELAEKYRKKSNVVMILFFVALAIGIFLCIVLSEYLTVAAVIGTLIQMMFFIIHVTMRKRQIQYTEDETAKSKAIFFKKFMKAMFIVVVIAGITLFFIGLLVIW